MREQVDKNRRTMQSCLHARALWGLTGIHMYRRSSSIYYDFYYQHSHSSLYPDTVQHCLYWKLLSSPLLSSTAAFYLQRCVVEMRRIEISWSDDIGLCLIYGYSEDLAKIHLTGTHFRTWLDLICLSRKKFKNTTTPGPFDANLFPKFDLNGVI